MKKTTASYEITCVNLKTFFSTFTPTCILKCTVQLKDAVLTWKARFSWCLKPTKTKKIEHAGKKPSKLRGWETNSFEHEQKLVKIDDFNDEEEKIIKERVEKRKKKRQDAAEKNKALKRKKKPRKKELKKLSYGND